MYFIDPKLVNGENTPVWFQEYYLHLLGPVLIIADALFLSRSFTNILRGAAATLSTCLAYIAWSEIFVGPLNDKPVGTVTSGLPYPFLNDMVMAERLNFYGVTTATAIGFYVICWIVSMVSGWIARPRSQAH